MDKKLLINLFQEKDCTENVMYIVYNVSDIKIQEERMREYPQKNSYTQADPRYLASIRRNEHINNALKEIFLLEKASGEETVLQQVRYSQQNVEKAEKYIADFCKLATDEKVKGSLIKKLG